MANRLSLNRVLRMHVPSRRFQIYNSDRCIYFHICQTDLICGLRTSRYVEGAKLDTMQTRESYNEDNAIHRHIRPDSSCESMWKHGSSLRTCVSASSYFKSMPGFFGSKLLRIDVVSSVRCSKYNCEQIENKGKARRVNTCPLYSFPFFGGVLLYSKTFSRFNRKNPEVTAVLGFLTWPLSAYDYLPSAMRAWSRGFRGAIRVFCKPSPRRRPSPWRNACTSLVADPYPRTFP